MENRYNNDMSNLPQDEISITDILRKLWQRRGVLVVLPATFFLLAVIYLFFTAIETSAPTVYFIKLKGIEKSTYPNGVQFSPQDLLITEVLERAAEQLKMTPDDAFRKAIQVEYGTPSTTFIHEKNRLKLKTKGLSIADLEQINTNYLDELQSASIRGLRITIDHESLGLSPEQGIVLAKVLPQAWTNIYTTKFRVFVDTRLDNVSIVARDNQLNTTAEILSARKTLDQIKRGLDLMNADLRIKSIVSGSGLNSSDLQSQLQQFKEISFLVIYNEVFASPDVIAASFLAETKLKIAEINKNIEELNQSLVNIQSFRSRPTEKQDTGGLRESVQLGEDALKQIIELASQASLADFMRQILIERRQLSSIRASLQTNLSRAVKQPDQPTSDILKKQAALDFSVLTQEYASLLASARKLSKRSHGSFYQPLGDPFVVKSALPPKTTLMLVMSILLGTMIASLIALIWPNRSRTTHYSEPEAGRQ